MQLVAFGAMLAILAGQSVSRGYLKHTPCAGCAISLGISNMRNGCQTQVVLPSAAEIHLLSTRLIDDIVVFSVGL